MNALFVRRAALLFLATLIGVSGLPAHAQNAAANSPERTNLLRAALMEDIAKLQDKLKRAPDEIEIRDITNSALVTEYLGNPALAESLLRTAYDQQDMHPGATFGEMPWNLKTRTVHDANAIDFATESLGPILAGYEKQLSPAFLEYIRPHAAASLVALARQPILVSYSNIYVMNFTNSMLIAEFLHDDAMTQRAYQHLDTWLDYTGANGIHEFDSPTYNAVVMNSLYMGYQHSSSPAVREKFHHALDYLWTDLNANFFAGGRKLGGAHSRDYDFLYGRGSLDDYYFLEGYAVDLERNVSPERAFLLENCRPGGYHSPLRHFDPANSRIITQRWDQNPESYRYTYITPAFAMGIADGGYGPQDKMFAFDFPAAQSKKEQPIPTVYLATTAAGIPYGKDRSLDRSGHSKPKHLPNGFAAVQDPKFDKNANQLSVDMVLPATGSLTVNGSALAVSSKLNRPIHSGDVIGIRIANTCFAVMPFAAGGSLLSQTLQADSDGLSYGAIRLATLFRTNTHSEQMPSAYLAFAQTCSGPENSAAAHLRSAQVKSAVMPHVWTVEAAMDHTALTVSYNVQDRTPIETRVNGTLFTTPPLHVLELKDIATK